MIKLGDEVEVYFIGDEGSLGCKGIVKYKACAAGDCWVIEGKKGSIHYIQTFEQIIKLAKSE